MSPSNACAKGHKIPSPVMMSLIFNNIKQLKLKVGNSDTRPGILDTHEGEKRPPTSFNLKQNGCNLAIIRTLKTLYSSGNYVQILEKSFNLCGEWLHRTCPAFKSRCSIHFFRMYMNISTSFELFRGGNSAKDFVCFGRN